MSATCPFSSVLVLVNAIICRSVFMYFRVMVGDDVVIVFVSASRNTNQFLHLRLVSNDGRDDVNGYGNMVLTTSSVVDVPRVVVSISFVVVFILCEKRKRRITS